MSLASYCGPNSTLWNWTLSWETEIPDLTQCFTNTFLIWLPCLLLWLLLPFEVLRIWKSKDRFIIWAFLNILKFMTILLLVLLQAVNLLVILARLSSLQVYPFHIFTPLVQLITMTMVLLLMYYDKKAGIPSSAIIWSYSLVLLICKIPHVRSLLVFANDYDNVLYSFEMVEIILVSLFFFLQCWSDDIPQYAHTASQNPCPIKYASFLSKITFSWFEATAWIGWRKGITDECLWDLNVSDKCATISPQFYSMWRDQHKKQQRRMGARGRANVSVDYSPESDEESVMFNTGPVSQVSDKPHVSILYTLCCLFCRQFVCGLLLKSLYDVLQYINPQILGLIINFMSEDSEPLWHGYFYACCLVISNIIMSVLLNRYFIMMQTIGMRIRSCLIDAVFRKSLSISHLARKSSTVGEIVNLMSVDAQRFMDLMTYLCLLWSAPFQICLAIYFLYQELGLAVFSGLAVMIVLIPVNACIANASKRFQLQQMKYKDERIKLMNELLNGIRVLKMYAWEPSFMKKVLDIRSKEIDVLKKSNYLNAGVSFVWICAPFLVCLASFTTFVLSSPENVLTSRKAFVSLSLFNSLRFPLSMLPMIIVTLIQASVSLKRMNKFLNAPDLDEKAVSNDTNTEHPITVENAYFSWDDETNPTIKNLSLSVKKGQLVAVVGTIGSGKSSLLMSLLGEIPKISGRVNVNGSVAYVAQEAWIQNDTLKANILFGACERPCLYETCLDSCALRHDLETLTAGDLTEIGEKGINLSGGQKQRISLARAVYSERDIYLLDDPLSAVDANVGKHIFEHVIGPQGVLNNKTRILVTHSLSYLSMTDVIVVMKDGSVSEVGTYSQLVTSKGAFSEFLQQYSVDNDSNQKDSKEKSSSDSEKIDADRSNSKDCECVEKTDKTAGEAIGKLIEMEQISSGKVKLSTYWYYIKTTGVLFVLISVLLTTLTQGCTVGSSIWLTKWTDDPRAVNSTSVRDMYLGVYGGIGFLQAVFSIFTAFTLYTILLLASKRLHENLLSNVLHQACSFFDTTPLGRIVNRFSKDVDTMDNTIVFTLRSLTSTLLTVLGTFFLIVYATPKFLIALIPIIAFYYFILVVYVATSRQLKRMESVSRSPIYSHFSETLLGTITIRAYNKSDDFIQMSQTKVDNNQVCYYPSIIANRWLSFRLDMVGTFIILLSVLFSLWMRGDISSGLVGVSISYALQVTVSLGWLVRMSSDLETNIVSVERMKEYTELPQEGVWVSSRAATRLDSWPARGRVCFQQYSTRYRPGLDLVLRNIQADIEGGEKVGIVGRTGAGKSSLTLALFRVIEAASGCIEIDGVNIASIGLHELRQALSVIPQEPVLFSGTLRQNLDPFEVYSDQQVWAALESCHLKSFVVTLPDGIYHEISEGGNNISVGQRQLVCLGRALLRNSKIIVLDEATAAVDMETDELIQTTIRTKFTSSTVITIAHRINTILDYDRIMVLSNGELAEFDTPRALLSDDTSIFHSMASHSGLV